MSNNISNARKRPLFKTVMIPSGCSPIDIFIESREEGEEDRKVTEFFCDASEMKKNRKQINDDYNRGERKSKVCRGAENKSSPTTATSVSAAFNISAKNNSLRLAKQQSAADKGEGDLDRTLSKLSNLSCFSTKTIDGIREILASSDLSHAASSASQDPSYSTSASLSDIHVSASQSALNDSKHPRHIITVSSNSDVDFLFNRSEGDALTGSDSTGSHRQPEDAKCTEVPLMSCSEIRTSRASNECPGSDKNKSVSHGSHSTPAEDVGQIAAQRRNSQLYEFCLNRLYVDDNFQEYIDESKTQLTKCGSNSEGQKISRRHELECGQIPAQFKKEQRQIHWNSSKPVDARIHSSSRRPTNDSDSEMHKISQTSQRICRVESSASSSVKGSTCSLDKARAYFRQICTLHNIGNCDSVHKNVQNGRDSQTTLQSAVENAGHKNNADTDNMTAAQSGSRTRSELSSTQNDCAHMPSSLTNDRNKSSTDSRLDDNGSRTKYRSFVSAANSCHCSSSAEFKSSQKIQSKSIDADTMSSTVKDSSPEDDRSITALNRINSTPQSDKSGNCSGDDEMAKCGGNSANPSQLSLKAKEFHPHGICEDDGDSSSEHLNETLSSCSSHTDIVFDANSLKRKQKTSSSDRLKMKETHNSSKFQCTDSENSTKQLDCTTQQRNKIRHSNVDDNRENDDRYETGRRHTTADSQSHCNDEDEIYFEKLHRELELVEKYQHRLEQLHLIGSGHSRTIDECNESQNIPKRRPSKLQDKASSNIDRSTDILLNFSCSHQNIFSTEDADSECSAEKRKPRIRPRCEDLSDFGLTLKTSNFADNKDDRQPKEGPKILPNYKQTTDFDKDLTFQNPVCPKIKINGPQVPLERDIFNDLNEDSSATKRASTDLNNGVSKCVADNNVSSSSSSSTCNRRDSPRTQFLKRFKGNSQRIVAEKSGEIHATNEDKFKRTSSYHRSKKDMTMQKLFGEHRKSSNQLHNSTEDKKRSKKEPSNEPDKDETPAILSEQNAEDSVSDDKILKSSNVTLETLEEDDAANTSSHRQKQQDHHYENKSKHSELLIKTDEVFSLQQKLVKNSEQTLNETIEDEDAWISQFLRDLRQQEIVNSESNEYVNSIYSKLNKPDLTVQRSIDHNSKSNDRNSVQERQLKDQRIAADSAEKFAFQGEDISSNIPEASSADKRLSAIIAESPNERDSLGQSDRVLAINGSGNDGRSTAKATSAEPNQRTDDGENDEDPEHRRNVQLDQKTLAMISENPMDPSAAGRIAQTTTPVYALLQEFDAARKQLFRCKVSVLGLVKDTDKIRSNMRSMTHTGSNRQRSLNEEKEISEEIRSLHSNDVPFMNEYQKQLEDMGRQMEEFRSRSPTAGVERKLEFYRKLLENERRSRGVPSRSDQSTKIVERQRQLLSLLDANNASRFSQTVGTDELNAEEENAAIEVDVTMTSSPNTDRCGWSSSVSDALRVKHLTFRSDSQVNERSKKDGRRFGRRLWNTFHSDQVMQAKR